MQVEKFMHDGKEFEIRVSYVGETVYVKVFQGNKPATHRYYSATIEVIRDMRAVMGLDAVKNLIDDAKRDIVADL